MLIALAPLAVAALVAGYVWSVSIKKPLRLLAIYAAIVPFASLISLPVGLPAPFNTLSSFVGMVLIVAIGVSLVATPNKPWVLHSTTKIWLAFLGVAALTWFWSVNRSATGDQLLILGGLVVLYVLTSFLRVSWKDIDIIENAIIAGSAFTGLYGVFLLATGNLFQTIAGDYRFAVTGAGGEETGDPNITAAALLLPLALALSRFIHAHAYRLMWFGATAAIAGGVVLTGSRGGILGLLVAAGIVIFNSPRRVMGTAGVAAILLVALAITPETVIGRFENQGSTGRSEIWRGGLEACSDYCAYGSGWGTFQDVFSSVYYSDPSINLGNPRKGAHNVLLGTAVEAGIAGAALLLLGLIVSGRDLWRLPVSLRGPPLAGLAGVVFTNIFVANFDFKYFWLALTYGLLVTLAYRTWGARPEPLRQYQRRSWSTARYEPPRKRADGEALAESGRIAVAEWSPLALTDVPGVGKATARRLRGLGIRTVDELASMPFDELAMLPGLGESRAVAIQAAAFRIASVRPWA